MTNEEILSKMTVIVRDVVDDDTVVLTMDTTAKDVPNWDSMAHISIIVGLEQAFRIKFKTASLEEAKTTGDLVRLVAAGLEK